MIRALWIALLLLAEVAPALAAAPNTLGYQGRLANASGTPITSNLNITFRIYDVASGGGALWTETQSAVAVDGGNLAVELGSVTPLPATIWGRQLYLGVQIAGDSEMLPRPALTAAPFALRAAGTMRNTIVVSAEGTAAENGVALLAVMPRLSVASASNPLILELDAGTFDIGNQRLNLPSYVTIAGAGQESTLITSTFPQGTLLLASYSHAKRLTARNTGIPPTDNDFTFGIGAMAPTTFGLVQDISLEDVTGDSEAPSGSVGARHGITLCTTGARLHNVVARAAGGNFSFGLRSDCFNDLNSNGLSIDGLTLISRGGAQGVRGAYIAGGGPWLNVKVFVDTNATAGSVYGIRAFHSALDAGAAFTNLFVNISGEFVASTTAGSVVEGVRLESADILFKGLVVNLEHVRAQQIAAVRVTTLATGPNPVPDVVYMHDATITVDGLQQADLGGGNLIGVRAINAALQLTHSSVRVTCDAGATNPCIGVRRESLAPGLQPGALVLDQVSIEVAHVDPSDTGALSRGYEGEGPMRMVNSSVRVLRSPDGESQAGLLATAANADFRVVDSSIEIVSTTTPTADCTLGGTGGTIEVFSSHLQGNVCTAGATLTCAGNTRRGAGFLASSCQ